MENQKEKSQFCKDVKEFAEQHEATIKADNARKALIVIAVDNNGETTEVTIGILGKRMEILKGVSDFMSENTELVKGASALMMIKGLMSKVESDESDNH